jgi:hypothetical protein
MSAPPGFPRCARYSVLRRDLGPKPRPKVHLRWRTGDWTALLPVLNEKFSSKSLPGRIRPILGEYDRNPYSCGAGPAPMRRHHQPHQSVTVAEKNGGSGGTPTFTGAQAPSCPAAAGFPRCRMSIVIFAESHTDRAMGPDMWLGARVFAHEAGPLPNHRRGAQSTGWPTPRLPVLQAKLFYRDTI